MIIDWSQKLLNLKGQPMKDADDDEATLGKYCMDTLYSMTEKEKTLSGKEKYDISKVAKKLRLRSEENFTIEELAVIKDHVGRKSSVYLVELIYDMLDPTAVQKSSAPVKSTEPAQPVAAEKSAQ